MPSDYRFSPALVARIMGLSLAVLGLGVFVATAAVGLLDLPVAVLAVAMVTVVVVVLVMAFALSRKAYVVRLDDAGYQVRFVRGAGVKQARWKDVEDVVVTPVAGERCVVLRLKDGRTTAVPVLALAGRPEAFVADLQQHLDQGHGYRRIT